MMKENKTRNPLDLDNWMKEIKEKAERLEKEINDGWKIERSGFFISIPTPKRFLECKEKDWEVARLYGMLKAIKEIKQRIKEVVEGLLKEIDKAIGYYTIQNALNESTFRNERIEGLKIAKELIRKYFPEEVKENEKENN